MHNRCILILTKDKEDTKMKRYEIIASKGKDINYIKTHNPVEAQVKEWEYRMAGYKTKTVITETK